MFRTDQNPCRDHNFWVDYALLGLSFLFRNSETVFTPVTSYVPESLRQINSTGHLVVYKCKNSIDFRRFHTISDTELGYMYHTPESIITPLYLLYRERYPVWYPGLRFVGPISTSISA